MNGRGVDLISDALPFGGFWCGEPNAVSNTIDYAKFYSRSHDASRVYSFRYAGNPKAGPQRNQITRKLAISKFANWILCFCHIRLLAMGRFN